MSNVILLSGLHDASEEETGFDPSIDPEMAAEGGWGEEGQEPIPEEGAYDHPDGDAGEYQAEMGADGEPTDEAAYQDTADWLMQGGGQAPEAPASGGSWGGGGGGAAPAAPQDPYAAQAAEEEVVPVACESGYAAVKRTDGKWVCVKKTGALQDESPLACPTGQMAVQNAKGFWSCTDDPSYAPPVEEQREEPSVGDGHEQPPVDEEDSTPAHVIEPWKMSSGGCQGGYFLVAPGAARHMGRCAAASAVKAYTNQGFVVLKGCEPHPTKGQQALYQGPDGVVQCRPASEDGSLLASGWTRFGWGGDERGPEAGFVMAMKAPGKAPVKVTARLLRAAGPAAITWKKSRPTAMFFSPVSKEARGVQRLAVSAPVSRQMIQRATMANAVPRVVLRAARPAFQPMMKPTARVPAAAARQVARVAVANKQVRR